MTLLDRQCRECRCTFKGGPRAFYCPSCREERKKAQWRNYQRRKRAGEIRPIGSYDKCERCENPYKVQAGLQRFCADCQPIHEAEHDRKTSLEFYHKNKDEINPLRNIRRRIGAKNCLECGKEFFTSDSKVTCSDECRAIRKKRQMRESEERRKRKRKEEDLQ